jgi:hypothetical protein
MNSSHTLALDPPEGSTTSMHLPFTPRLAAVALFAAMALGVPPSMAADAPQISDATMSPLRFAVDHQAPPESQAGVARGTTFSYRVSEDSDVVFFLDRGVRGRSVGGHCRRETSRNKKHHKLCPFYVRSGSFRQNALKGPNTKHFSGRIGRFTLPSAHYKVRLVAVDSMGNPSPSAGTTLRFTVLSG